MNAAPLRASVAQVLEPSAEFYLPDGEPVAHALRRRRSELRIQVDSPVWSTQ